MPLTAAGLCVAGDSSHARVGQSRFLELWLLTSLIRLEIQEVTVPAGSSKCIPEQGVRCLARGPVWVQPVSLGGGCCYLVREITDDL